jgi:hypothetical protein
MRLIMMDPKNTEEVCKIDTKGLEWELRRSIAYSVPYGEGWRRNFVLEDDLWQTDCAGSSMNNYQNAGQNNEANLYETNQNKTNQNETDQQQSKNKPIGRIHLPVHVFFCQEFNEYEDFYRNEKESIPKKIDYHIALISVFSDRFFKGAKKSSFFLVPVKSWSHGEDRYLKNSSIEKQLGNWSQSYEPDKLTVIETDGFAAKPKELIMGQHIPKFLKLYEETKGLPADTESLQCIRRAFTDYR